MQLTGAEIVVACLKEQGVDVMYFPYTKGTSSSLLRETINRININK